LRRPAVIWFTAVVTLFLFVYLFVALLRPERF
jgi:K+-transporting ATPase KdpF subunit